MLVQCFALISALSFSAACPAWTSSTNNCACTSKKTPYTEEQDIVIKCSNIEKDTDLWVSLREFEDLDIHTLRIKNSFIRYIAHDLFHSMRVKSLYFENSSIVTFSDTGVAFEGLEDSLVELYLVGCDYMDSWDFSIFRNHRAMEIFFVEDSDMKVVRGADSRERSSLKILSVIIRNSRVSYISDYAFADFDGLYTFIISSNKLRNVKRSMLPNPAYDLATIDLSYNELTKLPRNFFTNMPKLEFVTLNGNQFTTLKEVTFAPVWDHLHSLEVTDNKIKCDCSLMWILQERNEMSSVKVTCFEPTRFKGEDLMDFSLLDLKCRL